MALVVTSRSRRQHDRGDNGQANSYASGDEIHARALKAPSARRHNRCDGQKTPSNDQRDKG